MTLDLAALRAFSAALLAMADATRVAAPAQLMNEALVALRPLVPFRSAWWGECSDGGGGEPPRNWLHGLIDLSPTFAEEWNALAGRDAFAGASMQRLGEVIRFSGHADPEPAVEDFARRHRLDHAMAVTVELPGSGLMFFVALYRGEAGPAFGEVEAALFAEFTAHLVHHWRARVRELLIGLPSRSGDTLALADATGTLLYLGRRLGRVLAERLSPWSGSTLPAELVAQFARAPCSVPWGAARLALHPCGELVALMLDRGDGTPALPPRERSVAVLYSQGRSYKEIARLLGLSPATVRTYLRNVYLQLGVRNKVELGGALGGATSRRSDAP